MSTGFVQLNASDSLERIVAKINSNFKNVMTGNYDTSALSNSLARGNSVNTNINYTNYNGGDSGSLSADYNSIISAIEAARAEAQAASDATAAAAEIAMTAGDKAEAAADAAADARTLAAGYTQYVWSDTEGLHVTAADGTFPDDSSSAIPNLLINTQGVDIYSSTAAYNAHTAAMHLTKNDIKFSNGTTEYSSLSTEGLVLKDGTNVLRITPAGTTMLDGVARAAYTANGIAFYSSDGTTERVTINNDGMQFRDESGNVTAFFSNEAIELGGSTSTTISLCNEVKMFYDKSYERFTISTKDYHSLFMSCGNEYWQTGGSFLLLNQYGTLIYKNLEVEAGDIIALTGDIRVYYGDIIVDNGSISAGSSITAGDKISTSACTMWPGGRFQCGGNGYGIECAGPIVARYSSTTDIVASTSSSSYNVGMRSYASTSNPSRHGIYTGTGSATDFSNWMVYADGTGGTVVNTSSSKWRKENIKYLSDSETKKLLDVEVITFDYKLDDGEEDYANRKGWVGCIAEDTYGVIPRAVTCSDEYEDLAGMIERGENTSKLGIDYSTFTPYLIKLCQMQQAQIDDLTTRITALEKKLS